MERASASAFSCIRDHCNVLHRDKEERFNVEAFKIMQQQVSGNQQYGANSRTAG
jgi:hypothetical protein